jgi:hypothetical protein
LQEKENQQQMIVTSGMKCLESLEKQNQDGLLDKMLKALLISTKAWYSDRCLMTWKTKVSKANVLLFQLQASVHGIKEKGSGFLPTPTTMDHIDRKGMRPSRAATNRKTGYLSEMIKMYPTPRVADVEGGAVKNVQLENGHFFRENKKGVRWGVKLRDAVEMFPTPTTRDHKDSTVSPAYKNRNSDSLPIKMMKEGKPGGKLNPQFVELLMGYPMNWTKIDPTE